ncbi:MAG: hypothetical protein ACP5PM_10725, partial [Acidimicrobiales bacterium]
MSRRDAEVRSEPSPRGAARGDGEERARHRARRRTSWAARAALAAGAVVVLAGLAVALVFALGRPHLVVSSRGEALVTVHAGGLESQLGPVRAT